MSLVRTPYVPEACSMGLRPTLLVNFPIQVCYLAYQCALRVTTVIAHCQKGISRFSEEDVVAWGVVTTVDQIDDLLLCTCVVLCGY
jgi:hypothetical protein